MDVPVARRGFLKGVVAAATIVALDPVTKVWAAEEGPNTVHVPNLDGTLLFDAATLATAADDFGHIVSSTPWAVLNPGSVNDIVKIVKFAAKYGLAVAATRGIGASHSTFGQAQVAGGVVINMSTLAEIHEVEAESALVDAGVRLSELLAVTVPLGKSLPTITDFIELSVGGVLSAGGIGGQASRYGLMVDNVVELEVVTGEGKLVHCSAQKHRALFDAVRSGLGQFGILVRARLRLIDVPPMARVYTATYDDLQAFVNDQMTLADDQRFDYLEGFAAPTTTGGWVFTLEATKYFTPDAPPDDAALLGGLSFLPGTEVIEDKTHFDFVNRLAPLVAFLQAIGAWGLPHPWIDTFVPGSEAAAFVGQTLAQTTPASMGGGPILVYAFRREKVNTPFLALPDAEHVFLFSLLRSALPPTPPVVADLLVQNRTIYDALMAIGGKRYPVGSLEVTHADWQAHFGNTWNEFAAAKQEFDPDNVLTSGQRIF